MVKLRVGTRGSLLALTQTRLFTASLLAKNPDIELTERLIQTQGDISTAPLSQSPTPRLFVAALREALLARQVDFIVHSMKDLPAVPHPAIATACVPAREDVRDGLVSQYGLTLEELPADAIIGTSSPRRSAKIRELRPDLQVESIRGNIDTRMAKVFRGDYAATLLAMAGLNRINRAETVCQIFEPDVFVPAAGQGALSIECRADDVELVARLRMLDDVETRLTTHAERSVLVGLSAGCSTAIGATASISHDGLKLTSELAVESTGEAHRVTLRSESVSLDAAYSLGVSASTELLNHPIAHKAMWS